MAQVDTLAVEEKSLPKQFYEACETVESDVCCGRHVTFASGNASH